MTYEEALKARARLAYSQNALTKMAFQTKQAADGEEEAAPVENYAENKLGEGAGNSDKGNGVAAPSTEQELADARAKYKNLQYGLGAGGVGLATGAGLGAATYGLTGLFPSLLKRRLLRALIALGAGAAGGAGLGYLTYRGLQSGKVQDYANKGLEKAKEIGKQVVDKTKEGVNYVQNKINPPEDPNMKALKEGRPAAVPANMQ